MMEIFHIYSLFKYFSRKNYFRHIYDVHHLKNICDPQCNSKDCNYDYGECVGENHE